MAGNFEIGSLVVYGTNGLCKIEDIEMMSFAVGVPENPYYVLNPDSVNASKIYVPMNNEKLVGKMRKLMTKEEIEVLLEDTKGKELEWSNDRRARTEMFNEILTRGVSEDLVLMIRCIHARKRDLALEGKKLPTTDNNLLKQAEKLANEEFSYVLGISSDTVEEYVRRLIEID